MSEYLRNVFQRTGAPAPRTVAIARHAEAWANRQIADEIRALFDDVLSGVLDFDAPDSADLFVVPFTSDFLEERPGGPRFYRLLRGRRDSWVLLYGLARRELYCVPAPELYRFWKRGKRARRAYALLHRWGLVRWAVTVARWWNPRPDRSLGRRIARRLTRGLGGSRRNN